MKNKYIILEDIRIIFTKGSYKIHLKKWVERHGVELHEMRVTFFFFSRICRYLSTLPFFSYICREQVVKFESDQNNSDKAPRSIAKNICERISLKVLRIFWAHGGWKKNPAKIVPSCHV